MRDSQRLPNSWTLKRLAEIVDFVNGGTPSRKVPEYFQGTIPWITSNDVRGFRTSQAREYISAEAIKNSATHLVPRGSVLLVTRTAIGKVSIAEVDICISQDLTGLIIKNGGIAPEYLTRYLTSISDDLKHRQRGSTIKGLTRDFIAELSIPLPPLPVQRQIAAIMEKADAAREKRRQANQLTEQFLQSAFLEMFGDPATNPKGWEVKNIQVVCNLVTDGTHDTPDYHTTGIPLVTSKNLKGDCLDFSEIDFISEEDHQQIIKRSHPERGDILFGMIGTIGNATLIDTDRPFSIKNVGLFKPNPAFVANKYLLWLLRSERFLQNFLHQKRGGTQKFVSLGMLRGLDILYPPIAPQQKFAALVEKVETLRAKQRQSEQELEHLFNSLMQRAFRGELVRA